MATAEECRAALEKLTAGIADLDPAHRNDLAGRRVSCHVPDLGVTFVTTLGTDGADGITEAAPGDPPAQVRLTAASDDVVSLARDPQGFGRAWLTGKLKVEASLFDLLKLRKLA